jgi:hypothetical protein
MHPQATHCVGGRGRQRSSPFRHEFSGQARGRRSGEGCAQTPSAPVDKSNAPRDPTPWPDCRLTTADCRAYPHLHHLPYHSRQQLRGKRMATDHPGQGPVPGGRARWRGWAVRTARERPGSMGGRVFAVDWSEPGAGNGSTNGPSGANAGGSPRREHSGRTPDGRSQGRTKHKQMSDRTAARLPTSRRGAFFLNGQTGNGAWRR